jgi:hypothetical protein
MTLTFLALTLTLNLLTFDSSNPNPRLKEKLAVARNSPQKIVNESRNLRICKKSEKLALMQQTVALSEVS